MSILYKHIQFISGDTKYKLQHESRGPHFLSKYYYYHFDFIFKTNITKKFTVHYEINLYPSTHHIYIPTTNNMVIVLIKPVSSDLKFVLYEVSNNHRIVNHHMIDPFNLTDIVKILNQYNALTIPENVKFYIELNIKS